MLTLTLHADQLASPGPAMARQLEVMFTEGAALLERTIKPLIPIGVTEAGRGSLASEVRSGAGGIGLPIAVVGSPLKHVAVLNDGRRPGERPPPADALELWVRRKVRIDRVHKTGKKAGQVKTRKGVTLQRTPTESEARSIAFVIARAIGVKGIEGREFFEKGIERSIPQLTQIFAAGGFRMTVEIARGGAA